VALFDSLLSLVPDYQDAVTRRDDAAARQRAAVAYDAGRRAEDRGDWKGAIAGFDETLRLLPDHPDAARRRDQCAHRLRVDGLTEELRQHAAAEDWAAAVAVAEELDRVDPGAADPDGLATQAREAVRTPAGGDTVRDEPAPGGSTRPRSDPPVQHPVAAPEETSASGGESADLPVSGDGETSPRRRYAIIAAAGVAVLLVATLVAVLVNRGDSAPAPFKSAALFGFAKNLFTSDKCKPSAAPDRMAVYDRRVQTRPWTAVDRPVEQAPTLQPIHDHR
jgi:hypothetical protein